MHIHLGAAGPINLLEMFLTIATAAQPAESMASAGPSGLILLASLVVTISGLVTLTLRQRSAAQPVPSIQLDWEVLD